MFVIKYPLKDKIDKIQHVRDSQDVLCSVFRGSVSDLIALSSNCSIMVTV